MRITSIQKLIRIQFATLILFVINKLWLRPFVLAQNLADPLKTLLETFVFSFPNLCEAIVGTLLLTFFGLSIKQRRGWTNVSEAAIYLAATVIAGVYVILQELKIHNLGGVNVYDPYDLLYSVIGLLVGYGVLVVVKPAVEE